MYLHSPVSLYPTLLNLYPTPHPILVSIFEKFKSEPMSVLIRMRAYPGCAEHAPC